MPLMVITCGDCGAIFRLDRALLKDSHVARIRCRKCGGAIVVRVTEESQAPVLPPQETITPSTIEPAAPPQEPVSPWPVEAAAPAQEPTVSETDISDGFRPEPVPSPPDDTAVPPDNERIEPELEPALPGTTYSRVEDLFAIPPGEDAGPDTVPPEENLPEETAATEPGRKAPSRPAPFTFKVLVISVLWILLLAGGAFYFGTTKSGQDMLGTLFAGPGSSRTGRAPGRPVYDIRDLKWHVDKRSDGGSLFVIRGSVANVGNVPSTGIRIQATLLGKDNEALAVKAAFAGNLIDEASLGKMDREGIEGVMSTRFGEGNVNREIPKEKAVPFMVVFFDPAGTVESFMVRAIDVE